MPTTKEWAASHGLCVDDIAPPIVEHTEPCHRSAEDVAIRTIILHCVAAVGYKVNPDVVIEWLKDEAIWDRVSPSEQKFFSDGHPSKKKLGDARWRQEAEWALLWTICKIDSLGLPTRTCDTKRLVDEIMPGLGEPIDSFVKSASLRTLSELMGEDDRVYNLHCYARQAIRAGNLPDDLIYGVLFQRHYAFEWLSGDDEWDDVQTDT